MGRRGLSGPPAVRAALLARNTAINAAGQGAGLVAAVVLIPLVISGMGAGRFGLLAVAWAALGYFSFLDLGLGRATTHYVAGALARAERERVPRLVWTAALIQVSFGLLGALALAAAAAPLARLLTARDPEFYVEAVAALRILAFALPLVLVAGSFRGALEAAQRFGLVNAIAVPAGILSLALPLIGVQFGYRLPGIVLLLVAGRFAAVLAFAVGCAATYRGIARWPRLAPEVLREMAGFGGWVMVSNITIPFLSHAERFIIPYFAGVHALAFYAVPHEMIMRLAVLPGALAATLFPAFSHFTARDRTRLHELFARPARYILLALAPIAAFLAVFGDRVLDVWIGPEFAAAGGTPLRLLAVVLLLNGIANVPFVALQGMGRPDLKAKLDAFEVPIYVTLLVVLVPAAGIVGAALAKLLITIVDLTGLLWLVRRVHRAVLPAPRALAGAAAAVATLIALAVLLRWGVAGLAAQALGFGTLTLLYAAVVWRRVVDDRDRSTLLTLFTRGTAR
jgi:O-antigen/teichoic acid export membrane protein